MLTSIGHFVRLEYHRSPVDWWWLGTLFGVGIILIVLATLLQHRSEIGSKATLVRRENEIPVLMEDTSLKKQVEECQQQGKLKEDQLNAELLRARESSKQCEEERREALEKIGELETRLSLFSPLQIESFELAKHLGALAEGGRTGCSSREFHLMRLEYEQKFAPKVKDMMFAFAQEQGGEDSTLRQHVQYIDNGNDVLNLANALIRLAHMQDGIDCNLRYPS
jgi:hypothetical protein